LLVVLVVTGGVGVFCYYWFTGKITSPTTMALSVENPSGSFTVSPGETFQVVLSTQRDLADLSSPYITFGKAEGFGVPNRTSIPRGVGRVTIPVTAPGSPGTYTLQVTLFADQSAARGQTLELRVTVTVPGEKKAP